MQIRKLVKSGYASLVIAIPSSWIKENKLKAGDLVYVDDENGTLLVQAKFKPKKDGEKEIVINIDGKDDLSVMFEITSAYLDSYSQMIIKGRELGKRARFVKKVIAGHVALELVDENSEKIVAKDFLNFHDIDLKLLFRRMDNITRSMLSDTRLAVSDNSLVENIVDRDAEVNRLNFLIFKILKAAYTDKNIQRSVKLSELDILRYWDLNMAIEKVADRAKHIARFVPHLQPKRQKMFIEIYSRLERSYAEVMTAFYQLSITKADEVAKGRNATVKEIQDYIQKSNCTVCSQIAINLFNIAANVNDITRLVRYLK